VQPRPGRLVAAQPEHSLKPQRRDALLLVDDVPDRREPAHERSTGASEDRAGRDRSLRSAQRAAAQPVAHLPPTAVDRAAEPTRQASAPPQPLQVPQARSVFWEPRQQLMPVARVVDARARLLVDHGLSWKLDPEGDGTG